MKDQPVTDSVHTNDLQFQLLTEDELKWRKSSARMLLASKPNALILGTTFGIYIVKVASEKNEYWTFNENQALDIYNKAH